MNFEELQAEVFRRLQEDSGAPVFWSVDDVKAAINEGYLDLCEQAGNIERTAEIQCVGGLHLMDVRTALPYPFLGLRRALSRTLSTPLRFATVKGVDDIERRWEMSTSSPRRIMMRGPYTIGLYPIPDANEDFKISWTSLPDEMVLDEDEPELDPDLQEGVVWYALYDLKAQEDEPDIALANWNKYLEFVADAKLNQRSLIKSARTFIMGEPYDSNPIVW